MHIRDLDLCYYGDGEYERALDADFWSVPLRAIGWLEHPHSFTRGDVPKALISRLKALVDQAPSDLRYRGIEECSFCLAEGLPPPGPIWSQENILIPGDGVVYAAPGGVVHYIEAHSYLPPSEFVEAALRCAACGSDEYCRALQEANAGVAPPLEWLSWERPGISRVMWRVKIRWRRLTRHWS